MTYYQYKHPGITWREFVKSRSFPSYGIHNLKSGGYVGYVVLQGVERRVGFSISSMGATSLAKHTSIRYVTMTQGKDYE